MSPKLTLTALIVALVISTLTSTASPLVPEQQDRRAIFQTSLSSGSQKVRVEFAHLSRESHLTHTDVHFQVPGYVAAKLAWVRRTLMAATRKQFPTPEIELPLLQTASLTRSMPKKELVPQVQQNTSTSKPVLSTSDYPSPCNESLNSPLKDPAPLQHSSNATHTFSPAKKLPDPATPAIPLLQKTHHATNHSGSSA
eukprot:GHVR01182888.1.p1 GENE.GHVR01182888.1~~GHVR01182888.1.p1  ORF type:complete len:197 (+),score=3.63 GHVR01182888.1:82-672(+)